MIVLGIESSCDETGVAVVDLARGCLAHCLFSQIKLHQEYGGVVPELASRDHIRVMLPLITQCLAEAGLNPQDLDALAYTAGPGLLGALMVGACTVQSLGEAWDKPVIPVHHMEGHLMAPFFELPQPEYPFLALLVSGGHSQLIYAERFGEYQLLGDSLDDAAGEAFDKTAKLMGLPYPGGKALSELAQSGKPDRFTFPRPMTQKPGLMFSFSGLKTAVRHTLSEHDDPQARADIAHAFEQAVTDTLYIKSKRAIEQTGATQLVVAGGVSANRVLRHKLDTLKNVDVFFPALEFCTDNGAMIALAGAMRAHDAKQFTRDVIVKPRWPLSDLSAPHPNPPPRKPGGGN